MSTQVIESKTAFSANRIDRNAGVIRGVLLCGTRSKNGRRYDVKAFKPALYEGKGVYLNHEHDRVDRDLAAKLGWIANVTIGKDGLPRGDMHVLKSHPAANQVFELAERNPTALGLSHVASAKTNWRGGEEVVESIASVLSVDLVAEPATVKGLFESTRMNTVRSLCDRVGSRRARSLKRLAEAAGLAAEPVPGGGGGVLDGLKAAANALLADVFNGQRTADEGLKLIRKIIALADPMSTDDEPDDPAAMEAPEPEPAEFPAPPDDEAERMESVRRWAKVSDAGVTVENLRAAFRDEPLPHEKAAMREFLRAGDKPPTNAAPSKQWQPIFG